MNRLKIEVLFNRAILWLLMAHVVRIQGDSPYANLFVILSIITAVQWMVTDD